MYSRKLISNPSLLLLYLAIATVALAADVSAWGDCAQMYPDTDVATELSKSEPQNCTRGKKILNYANLLQDEHQLLTALKAAYLRKLDGMVESGSISAEERNFKITDFDNKLADLLSQKQDLVKWLSDADNSDGATEIGDAGQQMTGRLGALLEKCKVTGQALKRRIKQAKEEITDSETDNYCKLDFKFRVSEKLNLIIVNCL